MKCKECKKEIQLFVQDENEYKINPCSSGKTSCETMSKVWKDYWTEKYELAKIREQAIRYAKGIRDD